MQLENLYKYAEDFTSVQSALLQELERETFLKHAQPHMLSGHLQGRFLSMLSKLIKPKCIIEIGTYTGYSALCLAEGLAANGMLHTFERDAEKELICRKYFDKSIYKSQIKLHIVEDTIASLNVLQAQPQLVFIDADKIGYSAYYNAVFEKVVTGGLIIADNVLFHGEVLQDKKNKNAQAVHDYNQMIAADARVEVMILPLRDGLSITRKK